MQFSTVKALAEIVPNVSPSYPDGGFTNLETMYAHWGVPGGGSFWKRDDVSNHIRKMIFDELSVGEPLLKMEDILDEIIFGKYLTGEEHEEILKLMYPLKDMMRENKGMVAHVEHYGKWHKAISLLKDYLILNSHIYTDVLTLSRHTLGRQHAIGSALLFLKSMSIPVDYIDGEVHVDFDKGFDILDSLVGRIGGFFIINQTLKIMDDVYDPELKRYHFVRRFEAAGMSSPQVPVGYLFNLAVKNMLPRSFSDTVFDDYKMIIDIAKALCTALDVQDYNKFAAIFSGGEKIIHNLQRSALYDSIYTLNQINPKYLSQFNGLFDWVDDEDLYKKNGWRVDSAFKIARKIIDKAECQKMVVETSVDEIEKSLGYLNKEEICKIFEIFSHEQSNVNKEFRLPFQAEAADFAFKPLIKVENNRFFLPLDSWCALNFYESIAQGLRDCGIKGVTDKIGISHETVLKNALSSKGVSFSCGKYRVNGVDGECDIVVEASDVIIFLELKAKALTRKSRAGKDVEILVDVSKSLVESQLQLGNHEYLILRDKSLQINDNGIPYTIQLNGRKIERISVTLLEYTCFHDRIVLSNILETFHRLQVTARNKCDIKKIAEFSEKCQELNDQLLKIVEIDPEKSRRPFFNCWFMSLPKLLTILEDTSSNDTFSNNLRITRNLSYMSQDFYFEHSRAKSMKGLSVPEKTTLFTM